MLAQLNFALQKLLWQNRSNVSRTPLEQRKPTIHGRIGRLTTASGSCLFFPECLRKYQQNHVSGEPPGGGRSLRLRTDKADLRSAGSGLEKFRRRAWRALHHPRHVVRLSPEGWTGENTRKARNFEFAEKSPSRARLLSWQQREQIGHVCWKKINLPSSPNGRTSLSLEEKLFHLLLHCCCRVSDYLIQESLRSRHGSRMWNVNGTLLLLYYWLCLIDQTALLLILGRLTWQQMGLVWFLLGPWH